LVVDNDVLLRVLIAISLRGAGFRVIEAANAAEAIQVLRNTERVDVLLTDIEMAGAMDGVQLSRLVRTTWPSMRIAVVSGHAPEFGRVGVADIFIGKPFDMERLVQRIKELLKSTA
jgi:DNA-binding response OmpR family regulator